MSRRLTVHLLAVGLLGLAASITVTACSGSPVESASCSSDSDCSGPQVCESGYCVRPDDSDPPSLEWQRPPSGDVITGDVTLEVSASDDETAVQEVRFSLDGNEPFATDSDGADGWSTTWATDEADNRPYEVTATAVDILGNEQSKSIDLTVDNTLPPVEFVRPDANEVIRGNTPDDGSGYTVEWCVPTSNPLLASNPFIIEYSPSNGSTTPLTSVSGNQSDGLSFDTQNSDDCAGDVTGTQPTQSFAWSVPNDNGQATLDLSIEAASGRVNDISRSIVVDSDFPTFPDQPISTLDEQGDATQLETSGENLRGEITLQANASDPTSQLSEVTFLITDGEGDMVTSETDDSRGDGFTYTWNTTPDGEQNLNGTYNIDLSATDVVDHTSSTSAPPEGEPLTTTVDIDNTSPQINFDTPSDGAAVAQTTEITASANDAVDGKAGTGIASMTLSIDGSEVQTVNDASQITYNWDTSNADEGPATITVSATDGTGNSATKSISVDVDQSIPNITIDSPSAGEIVSGSTTIQASANDDTSAIDGMRILVDGTEEKTSSSGSISYSWPTNNFSEGSHDIKVTASAASGLGASKTISVTVDNAQPQITINSPGAGNTVSGSTTINATASDSGSGVQSMTIDIGGEQAKSVNSSSITYNWGTGNDADGPITITVTATDNAGRTKTSDRSVTVDNNPPSVNIDTPSGGIDVRQSVNISATASDSGTGVQSMAIKVGGQNGTLVNSNTGSSSISGNWDTTNNSGATIIYVSATDGNGRTGSATITVTVDNTSPSVSFSSPSDGDVLSSQTNLSADASDANEVTSMSISIDGDQKTNNSNASNISYSWDAQNQSDDTYTLSASATDAAGNTGTTDITVTVDNTEPTIDSNSPNQGATVSGNSVDVSLTASDTQTDVSSSQISINSASVTNPSGNSASYDWDTTSETNGSNDITFSATDEAGNTVNKNITVTVDNDKPNITVNSPTDSSVVGPNINLDLQADDDTTSINNFTVSTGGTTVATDGSGSINTTYTASSGGDITFDITATDTAGNTANTSITVDVDLSPPSVSFDSATPADSTIVTDTIDIAVSASDTKSSVSEIVLSDSDGTVDTIPSNAGTIQWDTSRVANGSGREIEVTATDTYGNQDSITRQFTVDNDDPNPVTVSNPGPNSTVSGSVTFDVSASDPTTNITSIELAGPNGDTDSTSGNNGTLTWNTSGPDGQQTVEFTATDQAGNTRTTQVDFTVDNQVPQVSITNFTGGSPYYVSGTVQVEFNASDNQSLNEVRLLDPTNNSNTVDSTSNFSQPLEWDSTGNGGTTQTLKIVAEDAAGNTASDTVQVEIDNTKPNAPDLSNINSGDDVSGSSQTLTIIGSDQSSTITSGLAELRIEDQTANLIGSVPASGQNISWDTTTYFNGSYNLTLIAVDNAGNRREVAFNVNINNTQSTTLQTPNTNECIPTGTDYTSDFTVQGLEDGQQLTVTITVDNNDVGNKTLSSGDWSNGETLSIQWNVPTSNSNDTVNLSVDAANQGTYTDSVQADLDPNC